MKTPIEVWPTRVFRGSHGYSAGHYAMLAGAAARLEWTYDQNLIRPARAEEERLRVLAQAPAPLCCDAI